MVELTVGQIFQRALLNTLLGMGTVFAVLVFISLLISLFQYIPKLQQSFGKKQETAGQPSNVQQGASAAHFGGFKFRSKTAEPAKAEDKDYIDDRELVAVITAAIAAYQGTSTDDLIVRSIKRAKKQNW